MKTTHGAVLVVGVVCAACGNGNGNGDGAGPAFASDHPRIYLQRHKDALAAALSSGQPAAMRFKNTVDQWVGGSDVYGFATWNAALIGQLTGDPKYCAKAIDTIQKQVDDAA